MIRMGVHDRKNTHRRTSTTIGNNMNKITTKFRTLGRLSVWVSISFGIAIATSQTANAWKAINNIDNNGIKAGK